MSFCNSDGCTIRDPIRDPQPEEEEEDSEEEEEEDVPYGLFRIHSCERPKY